LILFFPYLNEIDDVFLLDNLPDKARKKIVKNFRLAVQRHAYITDDSTFLAKNAVAGGRLGIYREAFPDMRVIYIESDMLRSVASSLSVFSKPWSFHSPACYKRKSESMGIVKMISTNHQGIIKQRYQFSAKNWIDIKYDDLVNHPEKTVNLIYKHFGMSLNQVFKEKLAIDCAAAKFYKSTHDYAIEDYGFTHEEMMQYLNLVEQPIKNKANSNF